MALQSFKSAKAAAAYAKNFNRNGRKRQPVIVALKTARSSRAAAGRRAS